MSVRELLQDVHRDFVLHVGLGAASQFRADVRPFASWGIWDTLREAWVPSAWALFWIQERAVECCERMNVNTCSVRYAVRSVTPRGLLARQAE